MVEPFHGKLYDPCCGSGGCLCNPKSRESARRQGRRHPGLGQESNPTTWRLCKMNLAMRSIHGDIGPRHTDTFTATTSTRGSGDYIIADPPFNVSDWGGSEWAPIPAGSTEFLGRQRQLRLGSAQNPSSSPTGIAGFVLSNGSLSRSQDRAEGAIARRSWRPICGLHRRAAGQSFLHNADRGLSLVHRQRQE